MTPNKIIKRLQEIRSQSHQRDIQWLENEVQRLINEIEKEENLMIKELTV